MTHREAAASPRNGQGPGGSFSVVSFVNPGPLLKCSRQGGGVVQLRQPRPRLSYARGDATNRARLVRALLFLSAAQRASIARQIAALEASIERTNNNLAGATAESGLRQQIGSLSVERGSLAAAEASEMQSARQQCRDEEKAEEERQAEAQRARMK